MIRSIIQFSITHRVLALLITVLVAGFGVQAFLALPIDAFPDLTNNQVNIVTEAPGMAAVEVEQLITYPIETTLMGIRNTEQLRSISKYGLSIITIVFPDEVDTYFARQLVSERLQEARTRIPAGYQPVLGPVATAFGEVYQYVVEGDGVSAMDLKTLHDWSIRPQLRTIPGVSEVNSWGGFVRQYQVLINPERLVAHGLSLTDVTHALEANNSNFGGSYIERGSEAYIARGLGLFKASDAEGEMERVVVRSTGGVPVLIRDVASVVIGPAVRHGAVSKDGKGEVVSGMVIMAKGENSHAIIKRIEARVEDIRKTLPAGVRIAPFYEHSTLVDRTTRTLATNLLEGGLLVILVLFLFLNNLRASLIVASVIPLSMLFAFIGMRLFGVTANLMSLGALDFGLMVDGAVVMMESFVRELGDERLSDRESVKARVLKTALEVGRPVFFGVVIIIAVYLPIFTLEGLEARMFRPMALTVCFALVGSLLLTLTMVPALGSLGFRRHHRGRHEIILENIQGAYRSLLTRVMRHGTIAIIVAVLLVAGGLTSMRYLGTAFMPQLDEGALLIETRRLPSISLTESVEVARMVENVVREFPQVETVVTKLGRPDLATEAMGIYQGDVYVILKPRDEWTDFTSKDQLIDALDKKLREVPGVVYNFTQPLAMRLDEVLSGVKADVAVKLFGDDATVLEREAGRIERVLSGVPGAADVLVETLGGANELQIVPDRERMTRYGLQMDDVKDVVETAVGGKVVTELIDGRRRFDVVVRLPEEKRRDSEAIRSLLIPTANGERVTLGEIAEFRTEEGPEVINREDAQRRIVIQANVRGRDLGGFVAEARTAIERNLNLPTGYYLTWGGEFENQERAMRRLYIVVPLAILSILLLLYTTFNAWLPAVLIIANIPFAMVGGIAALWLRGLDLSLSAAVGFVALFGVAMLNGVVMVSYINKLRREGAPLEQAILEGASVRFRPVLMTALVASLGFIPMALSNAPGAEVQRPLATVVIGGLITSTLLTLLVLPTLYKLAYARSERSPDDVNLGSGATEDNAHTQNPVPPGGDLSRH